MPKDRTVIGLDLGRHSVKAVWAKRVGAKPQIVRAETLRLPQGTADIQDILVPWLEKLDVARHPCVLGVPGHLCMFQPFLLPPGDPRSTEQAASMEVIRFNEMASEQMIFGYTNSEMDPGERLLLLSMARPTVLYDLLSSSKKMGLTVLDLIPTPVAQHNALELSLDDHNAPYLHIQIGHAATEITIGTRDRLFFARAFSGGGDIFTDALVRGKGISPGQAETLKVSGASLETGNPSAEILSAAAENWMSELEACLSVYNSVLPGDKAKPTRAFLAGAGAELAGLPDFLHARLNMEVSLLSSLPSQAVMDHPAQYVVAAGLAFTGLDMAPIEISLLPPQVRDHMAFMRQKAYWTATGLAAALILGISLAGAFHDTARKTAYLTEKESELKKLERIASQYETLQAENERIHAMVLPVKKLLRAGPLVRDLITLAANSLAPRDQIVMVCDAESFFASEEKAPMPGRRTMRDHRQGRASKKKEAEPETTFERIIIEGYTRTHNLSTVKQLISRLAAADFVLSADLLRDDELVTGRKARVTGARATAKHFAIDVKLSPP